MDSDKMFNQEVVSLCLYMHRQVASRLITKIRGENAVLIKESIKTTKKRSGGPYTARMRIVSLLTIHLFFYVGICREIYLREQT
jgi:hypothetical protein